MPGQPERPAAAKERTAAPIDLGLRPLAAREELIDGMARGRTTLSKPDIRGCLELLAEELEKLLAEGKYVKTPIGISLAQLP